MKRSFPFLDVRSCLNARSDSEPKNLETRSLKSTGRPQFRLGKQSSFVGAFAAAFFRNEESSPVPVICGRGRVLLWIRALRPDSIRADTSAESQTRARSPGTNTGSRTATEQRKLGGRYSGRIASESLEAVPKRLSRKTVKPRAKLCAICWRLYSGRTLNELRLSDFARTSESFCEVLFLRVNSAPRLSVLDWATPPARLAGAAAPFLIAIGRERYPNC